MKKSNDTVVAQSSNSFHRFAQPRRHYKKGARGSIMKWILFLVLLLPHAFAQNIYFFGEFAPQATDWSVAPQGATVDSDQVNGYVMGFGFFSKQKFAFELIHARWKTMTSVTTYGADASTGTTARDVYMGGIGMRAWSVSGFFSFRAGIGWYKVDRGGDAGPWLGEPARDTGSNIDSNPSGFGYYLGFGINFPIAPKSLHLYSDFTYFNYDDFNPPANGPDTKYASKSQAIGQASFGLRLLM
jgi:hypothetical protein